MKCFGTFEKSIEESQIQVIICPFLLVCSLNITNLVVRKVMA